MKFFGLLAICGLMTACAQPSSPTYPAVSYPSTSNSGTGTRPLSPAAVEQQVPYTRFKQRSASSYVPENLQQVSRNYIGEILKDPASAQYRFDFTTTSGNSEAVCGAVNSKNSYGGYVGYKRFYVETSSGSPVTGGLQGTGDPDLIEFCGFTDPNNESRSKDQPQS